MHCVLRSAFSLTVTVATYDAPACLCLCVRCMRCACLCVYTSYDILDDSKADVAVDRRPTVSVWSGYTKLGVTVISGLRLALWWPTPSVEGYALLSFQWRCGRIQNNTHGELYLFQCSYILLLHYFHIIYMQKEKG